MKKSHTKQVPKIQYKIYSNSVKDNPILLKWSTSGCIKQGFPRCPHIATTHQHRMPKGNLDLAVELVSFLILCDERIFLAIASSPVYPYLEKTSEVKVAFSTSIILALYTPFPIVRAWGMQLAFDVCYSKGIHDKHSNEHSGELQ